MATPTSYTKSISADFPNAKVALRRFEYEIRDSSISVSLDYINLDDDVCFIMFKDVLSSGEETTLNSLIAVHSGEKLAAPPKPVLITEEIIATGGNFAAKTIKATADAGQTVNVDVTWPHPISALSMKYNSKANNEGDLISMILCPDKNIGSISADISTLPSAWSAGAYVVDDVVIYTDPTFGPRVYTCIVDTTADQNPLDKIYWHHGFKINTSTTVKNYVMLGYELSIDDSTNTDDLGKIVGKTNEYLFVENVPTNTYTTGASLIMNIYVLKNFEIGSPWCIDIGEAKIGGSHLPKDTIVRLRYTNNYTSTQSLLGVLEYLF